MNLDRKIKFINSGPGAGHGIFLVQDNNKFTMFSYEKVVK